MPFNAAPAMIGSGSPTGGGLLKRGPVATDQRCPFQCSMSGWLAVMVSDRRVKLPTVHTSFGTRAAIEEI
jgi:hypothetical protein